jgi:glycosyltransferase involved in cell wall biosynthesis
MRIALIAPPWAPVPPGLYGGIESVVDVLARGFAAAGHDVLLFTTGDSTCPVPRLSALPEAEGMRIGMAVPEVRHVLAAYEAVEGYDVVHDHSIVGPVLAADRGDRRVVTTVHGAFNDELAAVYRHIGGRVPIVAISHSQRAAVPDLPVARVIHAADFPVGAGEGGYVLFLGRIAPDKGARRAILAARAAGVPLLLAGKMREVWEREYFDERVRPLLGPDVEYLGEVPHERKLELLAGARALLFPIRWPEPFGLVMIEALACGTPILAFPEGAAPEVVEHGVTGFLCEDEDDMASAILKADLLDRASCRATVEGYFSTERMVREHLELFEEVLAR